MIATGFLPGLHPGPERCLRRQIKKFVQRTYALRALAKSLVRSYLDQSDASGQGRSRRLYNGRMRTSSIDRESSSSGSLVSKSQGCGVVKRRLYAKATTAPRRISGLTPGGGGSILHASLVKSVISRCVCESKPLSANFGIHLSFHLVDKQSEIAEQKTGDLQGRTCSPCSATVCHLPVTR